MNVIMIGAHPDDCEFSGGGTAYKLAQAGCKVKIVSVTNGDKGHMVLSPRTLARIRRNEAGEAAKVLGVDWQVLDVPDCHVAPTASMRERIVAVIRGWNADVVISHRPNDYHPDHRNTGLLVQDTAYIVMVPLLCRRVPALRKNPVYLYFMDRFQSPEPFRPDIIVPIDDVLDLKVKALNQMPSQFNEWLPWVDGILREGPHHTKGTIRFARQLIRDQQEGLWRRHITARYGRSAAAGIRTIEAFQLCEYGRQPTAKDLHALIPGLPKRIDLNEGPIAFPAQRGR